MLLKSLTAPSNPSLTVVDPYSLYLLIYEREGKRETESERESEMEREKIPIHSLLLLLSLYRLCLYLLQHPMLVTIAPPLIDLLTPSLYLSLYLSPC
jgi:hypothetical protein